MENTNKFLNERGLKTLVDNIKSLFNQLDEKITTLREENESLKNKVVYLENLNNGFAVNNETKQIDIKLAENNDIDKLLNVDENGIGLVDNPTINAGSNIGNTF